MQPQGHETNRLDSTKEDLEQIKRVEAYKQDARNQLALKSAKENIPPIEVRTMRFILKYNPRFNVMAHPLCMQIAREVQMRIDMRDLRATIPWSLFEKLLPKIHAKLFTDSYWSMIESKRKAGYSEADTMTLNRSSKRLRQQDYIT